MRLGAGAVLLFLVVSVPVPGLAQDPILGFSVAESSGGEDGAFDMAVVLTTPDGSATIAPVTVDFRTIAGTALEGLDFVASSGDLTFPTGTASGSLETITVSVLPDDLDEATETFTVGLSDATGATIGASSTFTRTIVDADAEPTISIADLSVAEGQSGMQNAIFTVSLSAASGQDVTVTYATAEGTASGTSDFVPVPSTLLTIPAGATSAPLSVSVLGDTTLEEDETFVVNLTAPSHATLGVATATGTILDDDTPGSFEFSLDDFRVTEGASEATITVTRTGGRAGDVTVGFDVLDATAKSGVDFAPTTGTLDFGFDTASQTFVVPLMGDALSGATRTALLRLRSPSAGATLGARATAALTILDDDQAGRVQFGKVAFLGSEAAGEAAITLRRVQGTAGGVTVHLATDDGTAIGGQDFSPLDVDVTFGPGQTAKTVKVPITQDALTEGNESLLLTLSDPSGGAVLGTPATATLTLVDAQNAVFFDKPTFTAKEGTRRATIKVRRTGDLRSPVTVQFAATGGTAGDDDFTPTSGTLIFPASVATKSFNVALKNDAATGEGTETVQLALSGASGAEIPSGGGSAVLNIDDNDPVGTLQFSAATQLVNEKTTQAVIRVVRTGGRKDRVTVDYATGNGTATAPGDFEATSGTLVFEPKVGAQTFTVPIADDALDEGTESLDLQLSNPSEGAVLGALSAATLEITDNEPTLQFSAARFTAAEGASTAIVTVKRTGSRAGSATVHFETSDGTALEGQDFIGTSGDLTFAPGVATRRFSVTLLPDRRDEANETVNLTLRDASGAALGTPATATLNLVDNDVAGQVQFSATTATSLESGGPITITVVRTRGAADEATVRFEALPGATSPATAPQDFTPTSGTLTFGPGVESQTFTVDVADDLVADGAKSVRLRLFDPANGLVLGPQSEIALWLVDDE